MGRELFVVIHSLQQLIGPLNMYLLKVLIQHTSFLMDARKIKTYEKYVFNNC